jgi:AcrR family transcriptional regulator
VQEPEVPSDTRSRLLAAAVQRFYRDGFRNVGIDQILDDVAISKTAFYKHFRSKEDLMLAVLDRENGLLKVYLREMLRERGGNKAADQLRAVLDVVEVVMQKDDFHGCIFINAAIEFPLPHDPTHQAAARNKDVFSEVIFELAERAGSLDPQRLTEELCMVIDGAYVVRQVTGSTGSLDIARRLAERVIGEYLGA